MHGANVAIELELELTLENEHDLLFLMDVHRSLAVRFERDEVHHRALTQDWLKPQSGQELDGFDCRDIDVTARGSGRAARALGEVLLGVSHSRSMNPWLGELVLRL
jgi:hypothetical protein